MTTIRTAFEGDVPALRILIEDSVRGLSREFYTPAQIGSALQFVFGPDTQLIADGTYFVASEEGGDGLVAAGGWSRRGALCGGDQMKRGPDPLLDPTKDAARIRAFFVHPARARQGLGRLLLERCASAASAAGFTRLTLVATLPGEPLYRALGFRATSSESLVLPDGSELPVVNMERRA